MSEYASATLYFKEGTSDKVYRVVLQSSSSAHWLYDVTAHWGRRGSVLMSQPKLVRASLSQAEREMRKLLDAKRQKGYKDDPNALTDTPKKKKKVTIPAKLMVPKLLPQKSDIMDEPIGNVWIKNHPPKEEDSFVAVGNTTRRIKE